MFGRAPRAQPFTSTVAEADWPAVNGTVMPVATAPLAQEVSRFGFTLAFWLSPSKRSSPTVGPPETVVDVVTVIVRLCRQALATSWPAPTVADSGLAEYCFGCYVGHLSRVPRSSVLMKVHSARSDISSPTLCDPRAGKVFYCQNIPIGRGNWTSFCSRT